MPLSTQSVVRRLDARYLLVLAAVVLLVLVDQAIIQPLLVRLDAYAPVINLAGRQRMLSQKLAKSALALGAAEDDATRRTRHTELDDTLRQWSSAHAALREGDAKRGIKRINSPEIERRWTQLQPHYDAMRAAATRLMAETRRDHSGALASVTEILSHEAFFLAMMDAIVKLIEDEAAREVARLRALSLAIAATVVALSLGLGYFVVRPATRTIRRQFDELESRVEQRTAELADTLLSLQLEIVERQKADAKNRRLAAQLAHADRIESMGHLTVGLAHELNQPHGAIANYAEASEHILSQSTDGDDHRKLREYVLQIKRASLRAGQIVRRIRNFVRPCAGIVDKVDINNLVREIAELCRLEIARAKVQLSLVLAVDSPRVVADSIQIQQVLVNLVQNALQAMERCAPDRRRLEIRTSIGAGSIQVDVADSGPGFSLPELDSAFEPFHTTKPDGLGIGLPICRSIIESHGGTIWARSDPATGATATFTLPLANHVTQPETGLFEVRCQNLSASQAPATPCGTVS
jgi:two-component system sensor kinase FixL